MFRRFIAASIRALLMGALVMVPSALVPDTSENVLQLSTLLALIAALFTFVEYFSNYPSLVEFRDAPPFNRLRFGIVFLTVLVLSIMARGKADPTTGTTLISLIGARLGTLLDIPYSPVRLMTAMLPENAAPALVACIRTDTGVAYLISAVFLGAFVLRVRMGNWPTGHRDFNIYINLPTFDPTSGSDIVRRLERGGSINMILGFLLPFLIPAVVQFATDIFDPITLADPHTRIWTIAAWSFLPANLLMRGIAISQLAEKIAAERRVAYAAAVANGTFSPV